jgi:hypothetical protein
VSASEGLRPRQGFECKLCHLIRTESSRVAWRQKRSFAMGMKHPVRVRWYTILLAVVLGGILAAARGRSRSNIVVVLTRQPWRTDQQPIQRRTWRTFRRWVELLLPVQSSLRNWRHGAGCQHLGGAQERPMDDLSTAEFLEGGPTVSGRHADQFHVAARWRRDAEGGTT